LPPDHLASLQAKGTPPEVLAPAASDASLALIMLSKRGFDALVRSCSGFALLGAFTPC